METFSAPPPSPWKQAPGARSPGGGRGRGGAACSQSGVAGWAPPWPGPALPKRAEGRGARANLGLVRLSRLRWIRWKSCPETFSSLLLSSRPCCGVGVGQGEPRRDLRGLGQEPVLLPRGTQRRWWLRVHVLRTRHKLRGLSRDTCRASAAPCREEEPRQGSGTWRCCESCTLGILSFQGVKGAGEQKCPFPASPSPLPLAGGTGTGVGGPMGGSLTRSWCRPRHSG